ncbi:unnamed protein product [Microthlaspi erraticum]|uniref:peptidylprolyl isomerase n=1 Tax=Microthlaspi erraticum TaxID=1685480 RepID=A0A6D2L3K2_9BRAS|nr:unnamed protein product [Microthlaspi erraticum]CAA7060927.1 unnamed protein product [Microthlaspi erraticum]
MVFWGAEVRSGRPFTLKASEATGIQRLHLSQATLGLGNAAGRSVLQCNVGSCSPVILCSLSPEKIESCQLNIVFEEADDVIFSVLGAGSIHLSGYILGTSTYFSQNDDELESYGEDIGFSDMDNGSVGEYDYDDSFINDDDLSADLSAADDEVSTEIPLRSRITRSKARTSSSVLFSENGDDETSPKKLRKTNKREDETTDIQKNLVECLEKNKQAFDNKNIDEEAVTTKSLESEIPSTEEIAKENLDGEVAADGNKGCELVIPTQKRD